MFRKAISMVLNGAGAIFLGRNAFILGRGILRDRKVKLTQGTGSNPKSEKKDNATDDSVSGSPVVPSNVTKPAPAEAAPVNKETQPESTPTKPSTKTNTNTSTGSKQQQQSAASKNGAVIIKGNN